MTVTVQVPSVLRTRCDGASQLTLSASSLQSVLHEIRQIHPDLYQSVCDDTGAVRRHVNLFVNSSLVSKQQNTDTDLTPGDIVFIFQAVSGG